MNGQNDPKSIIISQVSNGYIVEFCDKSTFELNNVFQSKAELLSYIDDHFTFKCNALKPDQDNTNK